MVGGIVCSFGCIPREAFFRATEKGKIVDDEDDAGVVVLAVTIDANLFVVTASDNDDDEVTLFDVEMVSVVDLEVLL